MIPQYASNNGAPAMGLAAPGADEDIFARTQRILEAARAVQMTADARPAMNFPVMPMQPVVMQQPVVMKQQQQTAAQQSPVVSKPQMTMTAPSMTAPATTVSPTAAPVPIAAPQRRVSVENLSPIVQKGKRRASWLALLNKTDESIAKGVAKPQQQPPAKKARISSAVEQQQAAPAKKQQPKKLPIAKKDTVKKSAAAPAAPKDDKPKRPLSAYNLFFRHERAVILMHEAQNPATSKDELLGNAVPVNRLPGQTVAQRRSTVQSVLSDNPFHQDRKTRAHRKSHGKIGFTELVKLVAARWKRADDETKALFDDLSAEEKKKYNVAYEAWRARQPQDVLDKLDSKKSGSGKKSPSPTNTKTIKNVNAAGKPKKVSPPTKKAILAKAAASEMSCFAPMPNLDGPAMINDDFALLSDDELSAEEMDDLFPMPELAGGAAHGIGVHGMGVTGGVPSVAGGFDVAPLHGMTGIEAFPLDDSLVNFLTEFD